MAGEIGGRDAREARAKRPRLLRGRHERGVEGHPDGHEEQRVPAAGPGGRGHVRDRPMERPWSSTIRHAPIMSPRRPATLLAPTEAAPALASLAARPRAEGLPIRTGLTSSARSIFTQMCGVAVTFRCVWCHAEQMAEHIFTDPATGRHYVVDPSGNSRWIDAPPPPMRSTPSHRSSRRRRRAARPSGSSAPSAYSCS
jgi:hypothetical protein